MKKITRMTGYFGVSLVVLFTATYWLLKLPTTQQFILSQINAAIPGRLQAERFDFSLLKGELSLTKMVLMDPSGGHVARFERLFIDLDWHQLHQGELTVAQLILSQPVVNIQLLAAGHSNLSQALTNDLPKEEPTAQPEKSPLPLQLVWQDVQLQQGEFHYQALAEEQALSLIGITLQTQGHLVDQRGQLTLAVAQADWQQASQRVGLDHAALTARLANGDLEAFRLTLKSSGIDLQLTGQVAQLFHQPQLDLTLTLDLVLEKAQQYFPNLPPFSGRLPSRWSLTGPPANPGLVGKLAYEGGKLAGIPVRQGVLAFKLKDRQLHLDELSFKMADSGVQLSGLVDLQAAFPHDFLAAAPQMDKIRYQLTLAEKTDSLAALQRVIQPAVVSPPLDGQLAIDFQLKGEGIDPETLQAEAKLLVTGTELTHAALAAPISLRLQVESQLRDGVVKLDDGSVQLASLQLQAQGQYGLANDALAATLQLSCPDLTTLPPLTSPLALAGAMSLEATLAGTGQQPEAALKFQGEQLRFQQIPLGDVSLVAELLQSGQLLLPQLLLQNGSSQIIGKGQLGRLLSATSEPVAAPQLQFQLQSPSLFLQDFLPAYSGEFSFESQFGGTLDALSGDFHLLGKMVDLGVHTLPAVELTAELTPEQLLIKPLRVVLQPGEALTAHASLGLKAEQSFVLDLSLPQLSLEKLSPIAAQQEALGGFQGQLALQLQGQGTVQAPQLTGQLVVDELRLRKQPLAPIHLGLSLAEQQLKVNGQLLGAIMAQLELGSQDFWAKLDLAPTDLTPYFKLASVDHLGGALGAKAEVSGNLAAPQQLQAQLEASTLALQWDEQLLFTTDKLAVRYQGESGLATHLQLKFPGGGEEGLQLQGAMTPAGGLDFQLSGGVPLALGQRFAPNLTDLTGQVKLAGRVKGSLAEPEPVLRIELAQVGLTLPGLNQQLHDLNGVVTLNAQQLAVGPEKIRGFLDEGEISLSGAVHLTAWQPTRFAGDFSVNNLPLAWPDMLQLRLNSQLKWAGDLTASNLSGQLELLEGQYTKDLDLSLTSLLSGKQRQGGGHQVVEKTTSWLDQVALDIGMTRRHAFLVENNLATLALHPDLQLRGSLGQPIIAGRAKIESGEINYQKKKFVVTKGVIDFLNPYKIEPTLDIESKTKIRQYLISLALSGTPDALVFTLSSEPYEEEGSILSLLLLGKTTEELAKAEGGSNQSSLQMLAEMASSAVGEEVKEAVGLDLLTVDQGEVVGDEETTGERIRVTVGKQLSKRMKVQYAVESKDGEMMQEARSEYQFLDDLLLKGFQRSDGVFGGELLYRFEFR